MHFPSSFAYDLQYAKRDGFRPSSRLLLPNMDKHFDVVQCSNIFDVISFSLCITQNLQGSAKRK